MSPLGGFCTQFSRVQFSAEEAVAGGGGGRVQNAVKQGGRLVGQQQCITPGYTQTSIDADRVQSQMVFRKNLKFKEYLDVYGLI